MFAVSDYGTTEYAGTKTDGGLVISIPIFDLIASVVNPEYIVNNNFNLDAINTNISCNGVIEVDLSNNINISPIETNLIMNDINAMIDINLDFGLNEAAISLENFKYYVMTFTDYQLSSRLKDDKPTSEISDMKVKTSIKDNKPNIET